MTELGANLLGQERIQSVTDGIEEGSTSGVSTVNSVKSNKTCDPVEFHKHWQEYFDQITSIKAENSKFMQEILESQRAYQNILRNVLEEQRLQLEHLSELCGNIHRKIDKKSFT